MSAQASGVTPFVRKLHDILSDPANEPLVCWSLEHDRRAFVVLDMVAFAGGLLPRHFKSSNFCSFVRQLNLYGFNKVDSQKGFAFKREGFVPEATEDMLAAIQRRRAPVKPFPHTMAANRTPPQILAHQGRPGAPGAAPQQQNQQAVPPIAVRALMPEIDKLRMRNGEAQRELLQMREELVQARQRYAGIEALLHVSVKTLHQLQHQMQLAQQKQQLAQMQMQQPQQYQQLHMQPQQLQQLHMQPQVQRYSRPVAEPLGQPQQQGQQQQQQQQQLLQGPKTPVWEAWLQRPLGQDAGCTPASAEDDVWMWDQS